MRWSAAACGSVRRTSTTDRTRHRSMVRRIGLLLACGLVVTHVARAQDRTNRQTGSRR